MIDTDMMSTIEENTYVSPSLHKTPTTVKNPSASKSRCLFTNIFDVKKKTSKLCVGAAKSKRRSMKVGNSMWTNKTKRKYHSKINNNIKRNIYTWITRHYQVFNHQFLMIVSKLCLMIRHNLNSFQIVFRRQ